MLAFHQLNQIQHIVQSDPARLQYCKVINTQFYRTLLLRRSTEFLFVILFQYVGLSLDVYTHLNAPVWPSVGVAIGLVFLRGYRIWPGLLIGTLIATYHQWPIPTLAISVSMIYTIAPLPCRKLALTYIGPVIPLLQLKVLFKFFSLLMLISLSMACALGLLFSAYLPSLMISYFTLSINIFLGALIFAPFCLIWDSYVPQSTQSLSTIFKKNYLFLPLLLVNISLYGIIWQPIWVMAVQLLSLPSYYWIARQQTRFTATAATIISSLFLLSVATTAPYASFFQVYPWLLISLQIKLGLETMLLLSYATIRYQQQIARVN